ncbi:MAG: hypothetical protein Q9213_004437 [Squamulea squamosa]
MMQIEGLSHGWDIPDQRLKNANAYTPLPQTPKAIRVVALLPAPSKTAAIDCVLSNDSLLNNPQFEALSYTWGDPAHTRDISVNGKSFAVTENLFVALQHLRSTSFPRILWIDALCINQNDIPERNQQVQQMRDIYKQASEVLIWLGPESNTTAMAIDFMSKIPWLISGSDPPQLIPYDTLSGESSLKSRLKTMLQLDDFQERWIALSQFLKRPWWGRIWVSQEIALASKARFFCGNLVIEMPVVERFDKSWRYHGSMILHILAGISTAKRRNIQEVTHYMLMSSNLMDNRNRVQKSISQGTPVDITHLLPSSKFMNSTDPRDRIFALLGMTFSSRYEDDLLTPDYSLTTREVYIMVATHILKSRQTLDILAHVSHDNQNWEGQASRDSVRTLPSWVTDWSMMMMALPIDLGGIHGEEPIYQASLDRVSPVPIQFLADGLVLCVRGVLVDSILSVGSKAPRMLTSVFAQWRKMVPQADEEFFLENQTAREAFWRTILCDAWDGTRLSGLGNLVDGDIGKLLCLILRRMINYQNATQSTATPATPPTTSSQWHPGSRMSVLAQKEGVGIDVTVGIEPEEGNAF